MNLKVADFVCQNNSVFTIRHTNTPKRTVQTANMLMKSDIKRCFFNPLLRHTDKGAALSSTFTMLRFLATGGHLNCCQDNTELFATVAAELANFSNLYKSI